MKEKYILVSQGIKIGEFNNSKEAFAYAESHNRKWYKYKQRCLDCGEQYADNYIEVYRESYNE